MKEHHFRKYRLEDRGASIEIVGKEETVEILKSDIKDVFVMKSFLWGHVKWYHRLLVGLVISAVSIFVFRFTFVWSEQLALEEVVPVLLVNIGIALWIFSGLLFLVMITFLFEATSDFPGLTLVLSKKIFASRYRAVVIQRVKTEYHLKVKNKQEQERLMEEIKLLI